MSSAVVSPSISTWMRVLWRDILFPGPQAAPSHCRLSALLILTIVPGLLLYPSLGFHLFEPDEARYAEIPREMLVRGEWVVPYLQDEPYLDKPPLLYWLVMVSYRLLGVSDWAARLVPALALHASILLTYFLGRRSLGERSAFWGALILGIAPGFLSIGRLLVLDGLLAFCVCLSLLAAFEALRFERLRWSWWLVAALACGLGVLTKGPIAGVLLTGPLVAYGWLSGRFCRVGIGAFLAFVAVVAVVALPWYVAISIRLPEFGGFFFWKHNIVRFLSPFDHQRPVWFYGPIVVFGLLPGSLLLWPLCRFLATTDVADKRPQELGFMLLAGGWCVVFFSMSGCKLPTYVLPAFPMLALVLGHFVAHSRWQNSRWTLGVGIGAFFLMAFAHHLALPWYAQFHSPMSHPEQIAYYCDDPETPVVSYPRNCDSVSFYLGRSDLQSFRSKQTPALVEYLQQRPRTVMLFMHRNSLNTLRNVLPPELTLTDETPLFDSARAGLKGWNHLLGKTSYFDTTRDNQEGLCYMAVVQRRAK